MLQFYNLNLVVNGSFNTKFQHQTIWQDLMIRGGTNTKDKIMIYSFYMKSDCAMNSMSFFSATAADNK